MVLWSPILFQSEVYLRPVDMQAFYSSMVYYLLLLLLLLLQEPGARDTSP